MKIIKQGDMKRKAYYDNPMYRFECRSCGCIFIETNLYKRNITRYYTSDSIPCPACGDYEEGKLIKYENVIEGVNYEQM